MMTPDKEPTNKNMIHVSTVNLAENDQRSKTGETLLVRSVSPSPFPRTSSIRLNAGFEKTSI
jgi:hypothetical protein